VPNTGHLPPTKKARVRDATRCGGGADALMLARRWSHGMVCAAEKLESAVLRAASASKAPRLGCLSTPRTPAAVHCPSGASCSPARQHAIVSVCWIPLPTNAAHPPPHSSHLHALFPLKGCRRGVPIRGLEPQFGRHLDPPDGSCSVQDARLIPTHTCNRWCGRSAGSRFWGGRAHGARLE